MEELSQIVVQQGENIKAIDTVWVALCAALIFQMEGGFALLEAGFIRGKNAMSIIAKVLIDIMFGGLAFYIIGFGIAYGLSNGYFATGFGIMDGDLGLGLTVSNKLFWFIQLGFAIAAISIVSGAVAERMRVIAYIIYVVVFCALLYPLAANWVWNPNGWLASMGFNDFAGSAAVHAMGGFGALAAAMVLGPMIMCIISDENLDKCVDVILENASDGVVGDGKIFIYDVQDAIRISTKVRGNDAIR